MTRFELGRTVATPAALELAERRNINLHALITRHLNGDWGDVDDHDRSVNDQAAANGGRILSAYGKKPNCIWIITDAATDVCPACWAGIGTCEPDKGEWISGTHFRTDLPLRRLTTTILLPDDY